MCYKPAKLPLYCILNHPKSFLRIVSYCIGTLMATSKYEIEIFKRELNKNYFRWNKGIPIVVAARAHVSQLHAERYIS